MKATIIANKMANGVTGKVWMQRKGWTKSEFINNVVDFINSGKKESLYDFLVAK